MLFCAPVLSVNFASRGLSRYDRRGLICEPAYEKLKKSRPPLTRDFREPGTARLPLHNSHGVAVYSTTGIDADP